MTEIRALEYDEGVPSEAPKEKNLDEIYRSVKGADWNNVTLFKKGVVDKLAILRPNQG